MISSYLPKHVAIILDGNGRWASGRSVARIEGHKAGADNAKSILHASIELGLEYLTLFCFSSENWRRSTGEVSALMELMENYLLESSDELLDSNVRLQVIGSRENLSSRVVSNIAELEAKTKGCDGLRLLLALNYGGRWDMCQAVKRIAMKSMNGDINFEDIDESVISAHLETADIPDPDLLIRSGGELRLSNFLLWQLAYSELIFVDKAWPAFERADFENSLRQYASRVRRFGG